MADSVYDILEGEGLSTFSIGRGREMTYNRDPLLTYRLPDADINIYRHEPSSDDLFHPFRPSGNFIAEAFTAGERRFFSGSEEAFESFDQQVMDRIEDLDSSEYYKELNGF